MESARILVAMCSDDSLNKLKALFTSNGYTVIDQAKEGNESLRKIRLLKPDLAVIEYNLPNMNGLEIAKIAVEDKLCDVILIMSNDQKNIANCEKYESDFVMVTKPLNKEGLLNTASLVIKSRRKIMKLEKENEELRLALETRKDIEKAKGLLMKHLKLSEDEAFRRIQKQSMDHGIPMREIAKAIIIAYDI